MAKIFLDTNFYIDAMVRKPEIFRSLNGIKMSISALSIHILFYSQKIKITNKEFDFLVSPFDIVSLNRSLISLALSGPTNDLEDNIQLHSASESECDIFLTNDKKLLKMKFFGKMRIVSTI